MKEENFDRIVIIFALICSLIVIIKDFTTGLTPIFYYLGLLVGIFLLGLSIKGLIRKKSYV